MDFQILNGRDNERNTTFHRVPTTNLMTYFFWLKKHTSVDGKQAFALSCDWIDKDAITNEFVKFHRRFVEEEQERALAHRNDPFEVWGKAQMFDLSTNYADTLLATMPGAKASRNGDTEITRLAAASGKAGRRRRRKTARLRHSTLGQDRNTKERVDAANPPGPCSSCLLRAHLEGRRARKPMPTQMEGRSHPNLNS